MRNNILEKIAAIIIAALFIVGLIDQDLFLEFWVKIFVGVIFVGLLFYVARLFAR